MIALWVAGLAGAAHADVQPTLLRASDTGFSRPHDLVLSPDGRYLYVADIGNDIVKVLDPETLATVGGIGRNELSSPHDVSFDRDGRLLVADSGNDRVVIYRVRGSAAERIGELKDGLGSPEGVVQGADGRIYVTNASGHNVVAFTYDGRVAARAGSGGDEPGEYRRPHDIDVSPAGELYVADSGNNRIQILDAQLRVVASLGGAAYRFNEPKYLAFDARGWLYVADEHNNQVRIFDTERRQRAVIGAGDRGRGPGRLNKPEGVVVRGDRLWISDTYNDRVLLFRLEVR